ncbi:hypothetical protein NC651_031098 [Populus alba x Populus x berolinensis]|nr:hypothetical protein NC651_031098 [Populus alba x Populus x berolinensis]
MESPKALTADKTWIPDTTDKESDSRNLVIISQKVVTEGCILSASRLAKSLFVTHHILIFQFVEKPPR